MNAHETLKARMIAQHRTAAPNARCGACRRATGPRNRVTETVGTIVVGCQTCSPRARRSTDGSVGRAIMTAIGKARIGQLRIVGGNGS